MPFRPLSTDSGVNAPVSIAAVAVTILTPPVPPLAPPAHALGAASTPQFAKERSCQDGSLRAAMTAASATTV